jgi:hypothetical protein
MLLNTIAKRDKPSGDTRAYLDIDDGEAELLTELLEVELAKLQAQYK